MPVRSLPVAGRHPGGPGLSTEPTPPRAAERLLGITIADDEWRDSILGDLREEYVMIRNQSSPGSARWWYWRTAAGIGARGVSSRFGVRKSSFPSLAQTAELEGRSGWWVGFTRDLRHAWRTLARRPATSAVIVITLAVALATNSTSFAIMDALVLRPFRFPGLDRLMLVASSDSRAGLFDRESVAPADFADWRRESRTLTQLAAAAWWDANLSGIDTPEPVPGFRVTADFFNALRATPVLGRNFVADEEAPGRHRVAMLGHSLWTRLFASDPAIVGKTVRLDGEPYEVVGVAPEGFAIPDGAQVWAPLAYTNEAWANRNGGNLVVVGRLVDGVSIEQARAEIGGIAERLKREFPKTNGTRPNTVVTFTEGMQDPGAGPFIATMQGAGFLLLLIACANIANLLLARGAERSQEFAMRLALGASRARLAWQLMIEAAILSGVAVVVAMPVAWVFLALSRQSIPPSVIRFVPGFRYMDISPLVFWTTAALGALATLIFALMPAWQTVRGGIADTLRQGSRATTAPRQRLWLRNSLAAAQVALTLALLSSSALLLSAADNAVNGPLGFDKRNLLTGRLILPERPYADAEKRRQFVGNILARLQAVPAVADASMVSNLPYGGSNTSRSFYPDGIPLEPRDARSVDFRRIAPRYFETMGIPLISGRTFTEADRHDGQQVAMVSRLLVERYWPNVDPIGRRFRLTSDGADITVVGVVADILHDWFQQLRTPTVYRPLAQDAPFQVAFVVRTIGDPESLGTELRQAVRTQDPDQPLIAIESMEKHIEDRTGALTFIAGALGVSAAIALALALLGLYSLMAFMVSRRTQELGVRLALGATRWQVISVTTMQGLRITAVGLVLGGLGAFGLGRLMESALFGVVTTSALQLAALVVVVAVVSLLASYLPARRTARLDPTLALRAE